MTTTSATITDGQRAFIETQPLAILAVATADGPITLAPGGMDRLRIIAPDLVAWLDSGTPDVALANAPGGQMRFSLMICAFDGSQRLLRLHGEGKAVLPDDDEWDIAAAPFGVTSGARGIFLIRIAAVEDATGAGLPLLSPDGPAGTAAASTVRETPAADRHAAVGNGWVGAVLNYWLNEVGPEGWFASTDEEDARCAHMFRSLWDVQRDKPAAHFLDDADMALAAIILFDQFPRNMFRGQPRAFATDPLALDIARAALDRDFDDEFVESARAFFYMPFMHSEALADQERSLALFSQPGFEMNLSFARAHHAIIARFGRFPHRNAVLGRTTLPEEEEAVREGSNW